MSLSRKSHWVGMYFVVLFCASLLFAQDNCPQIQQESETVGGVTYTDYGMVQGANVTVEVVDNSWGDWNETQVGVVEDEADYIMEEPGNNGVATTVNTDTADPAGDASVAKPISIVEQEPQATVDADCQWTTESKKPEPSACTTWHAVTAGGKAANAYYTVTEVVPAAATSDGLGPLIEHEMGAAMLGFADCDSTKTDNCSNSISNPDNSLTAPSSCDNTQSTKDWCKCNLAK